MRRPAVRIALAALIGAGLLTASAATLRASCCAPPVETAVGAASCCGCDGSFSRPASADRTAIETRRVPLAAPAAHPPIRAARIAWTAAPECAARGPIPAAPSSPFPRRL